MNYSTENQTIIHHRSKIVDLVTKDQRKELYNIRKEFLKLNYKKPTDIIIFTDSYSYSSASFFIKAFQNVGGAITVGFNGNPNSTKELFDASQSPANVLQSFDDCEEKDNLEKLGFKLGGITMGESYEDDYKNNNSIPREYKLNPVDERVDIYEPYTDETYDIFIEKAKEIFKKYNEQEECNPDNKRLIFEKEGDNRCYNFTDDEYAHGGYICGDDGKWNYTSCQKYYCDLGYYYNIYEGKCIIDKCTNDPDEKEIILDDFYEKEIIINKENNIEYIFKINTKEYIYLFETSEPGYIHYKPHYNCDLLCAFQMDFGDHENKVYLNYYRNPKDKDIIIKIYSIKNFQGNIQSMIFDGDSLEKLLQIQQKFIFISSFDFDENYISYFKTFDESYKVYYSEYNQEKMNISDILNINKNYFKDISNKLIELDTKKIHIFISDSKISGKLLQLNIGPKEIDTNIIINKENQPLNL